MNLSKGLVSKSIIAFLEMLVLENKTGITNPIIPQKLHSMKEKWTFILTLLTLLYSVFWFSLVPTAIIFACSLISLIHINVNSPRVMAPTYFFGTLCLNTLYVLIPIANSSQLLLACLLSQIIFILNASSLKQQNFLGLITTIPLALFSIFSREGNPMLANHQSNSLSNAFLWKAAFPISFVLILFIFLDFVKNFSEEYNATATKITLIAKEKRELQIQHDQACKIIEAQSLKIASLEQELQELITRRDSIASSLSHEMRNPLNVILGNLDLLIMEVKEPKSLEMLESSRDSCEILLSLVNNVLDAGKIHSGQLEINPQPVAIFQMIQNLWSTTSVYITKKELTGHVAVDRKMPRMLEIDKHRVVQICFNVISNAVKFTTKGIVNLHFSWIPTNQINSMQQLDEELKHKLTEPSIGTMRLVKRRVPEEEESKSSCYKIKAHSAEVEEVQHTDQTEQNPDANLPTVLRRRPLAYKSMTMIIENSKKTISIPFSMRKFNGSFIQDPLPEDDLSLELTSPEGFLKIECLDSGCGITEQLQNRLFKEFERGDRSITRRFGGTGLGLYITRELVTLMHGWITVDTEEGTGTKVCIVIPAKKVASNMSELPSLTLKKVPSSISNLFNVLIVDDSTYNIDILIKFFNKLGLKSIYTAANGIEAVNLFSSKGSGFFALITMDLQMPEMDGFTACRKIREIERKRYDQLTPIVIISGNCSKEEQDQCLSEEGDIRAVSFYRKPITYMDVEALVRRSIIQASPVQIYPQVSMKQEHKKKTLLINGDNFTIDLLETLLVKYDWQLKTAADFQNGLQTIRACPCIEYVMIDCDKYRAKYENLKKVLGQLREQSCHHEEKENPELLIIALSSDDNGLERIELKALGFDKVLGKPIRLTNLREVFCIEAIDFTSPLNI